MLIEKLNIRGKKVYIFEEHNIAPIAWHDIGCGSSPALLTFDHHTDTHLAFLRYNWKKLGNHPDFEELVQEADAMCDQINTRADIESSIPLIRNDEHIDFSIRTNIISHAYVISHDIDPSFCIRSEETKLWFENTKDLFHWDKKPPRPSTHTYTMPKDKIIELTDEYLDEIGACTMKQKTDIALEDINLSLRMKHIDAINNSIFGPTYNFRENFILDIDLDYFNTRQSINPNQDEIFYSLIRRSAGITIARESWFVEDCKLENEKLDVTYLENMLIQHIKNAMLPPKLTIHSDFFFDSFSTT